MKIISKFKDYYDSIAFSQTPVWERKTTETERLSNSEGNQALFEWQRIS